MSQPGRRHPRPKSVLRIDQLDAVIFDMDGVVTDTAQVHAQCWKRVFDHYLRVRSNHTGEAFVPFTNDDYLLYVDGKPRYMTGPLAFSCRVELTSDAASLQTRPATTPS